ncbi:MAG: valine--pyruvate transaminase [Phycisphaerae bacterium]|nr:valine--pyruvate transaminase [Phycisphaerae bacterium]
MCVSNFTKQLAVDSGICRLMHDLGSALTSTDTIYMLGGGNPAHIPEVEQALKQAMRCILESPGRFAHMIGDYDPPHGNRVFARTLADLLSEHYWPVKPENIALTHGSQSAFFGLFNMLAGSFSDGTQRKILLPLIPEYIGYSDLGLEPDLFVSAIPTIEHLDGHLFKYHVDFDRIESALKQQTMGAICVSRPTNPTGNVLTNHEIQTLSTLASHYQIPLIIDNAYGLPFPGIIYEDAELVWNEHTILCLSLSKLGLPGTRTGIVIAHEDHIEALSRINAIVSLAPGGVGAALATELIQTGQMMTLSQTVVRPYYQRKCEHAVHTLCQALEGQPFYLHKPQGAFFLWLWLPELRIPAQQLYERLKARGVIVVPGEYFFPGLKEPWSHTTQCLRISYAQEDAIVEQGMAILAQEITKAQAV